MYIAEDNPKLQVEVNYIGKEYSEVPFFVVKFVNAKHNEYVAISYTFDSFEPIEDFLDKLSIAVRVAKDSLEKDNSEVVKEE